ncbi:MAG: hypothetical protein IPF72_16080 [Chitinophagaceae bacterium]|nr:hypothetical protein [Chitinophagaceae bacterium]
MKKKGFAIIIITVILFVTTSCTKDSSGGGSGGSGGGSTTGQAVFWTASDLGCGNITVTCNGTSKTINGFNSTTPNCGSTYAATFTLDPGTYNFTATCSGVNWTGTVTITSGTCSTMQLTGGGGGSGGGGGGTSSSQAIFWIASDLGCGPINVTCNGVTKQITAYTSSAPNCGTTGFATFSLGYGIYNFTASCSGLNWNGTISTTPGACITKQLTSSGGGGGGNCNWSSATNCVSVTTKVGTRCGDPLSVEITAKNNCTQNIKIYCCIQRTDGSWQGLPDGTFGTGVSPNGTAQWFVCKGTGQYKIFAMPVATFNSNNCSYPNCN